MFTIFTRVLIQGNTLPHETRKLKIFLPVVFSICWMTGGIVIAYILNYPENHFNE